MFEMISTERIESVMKALHTIFGTTTPDHVSELKAGSLSTVVRITVNKTNYILRVMDLGDNLHNRQNQISCLKKAYEMNLGPQCLYEDAEGGILVTEYIQPVKINVTKPWLSEMAISLQTLHRSLAFPETHQPLFDYMTDLATSLKKRGLSSTLIDYLDKIEKLQEQLLPCLQLTSCHNDLNFSNLLFDGGADLT